MTYVDGFLVPVPKENIARYKKMAQEAGKIWMEYGALAFKECQAEDTSANRFLFPKAVDAKENEVVMFSFITYTSRAHRDEVNAKVMADPRITAMCDPDNPPFDMDRMAYGGFSALVDL